VADKGLSKVMLRKEHGVRVLENRALRGIFRSKRDEVIEDWRKLQK
jgi:hypothetical protein